jgi:ABC-type sugar transport system ATPase subunit
VRITRCFAESGCKQFIGIPVLKNVDLEVWQGEVHATWAIGAGKSTMIKIITGVFDMDAGGIYIEGSPSTSPAGRMPLRGHFRHLSRAEPVPGARRHEKAS